MNPQEQLLAQVANSQQQPMPGGAPIQQAGPITTQHPGVPYQGPPMPQQPVQTDPATTVADAALMAGSGAVGAMVGGYGSLYDLMSGKDPVEAGNTYDQLSDNLTIPPTPGGTVEKAVGAIAEPLERLDSFIADLSFKLGGGNPEAATAIYTALMALPEVIAFKGAGGSLGGAGLKKTLLAVQNAAMNGPPSKMMGSPGAQQGAINPRTDGYINVKPGPPGGRVPEGQLEGHVADFGKKGPMRGEMRPDLGQLDPNAGPLGFDPAQNYPEAGNWRWRSEPKKIDTKGGGPFRRPEKLYTPQEAALQKVRDKAAKEVNAGDYEPYFDISQRKYADNSKYDTSGDTRVEAVPARQDTKDTHNKYLDTPKGRKALNDAYDAGDLDGQSELWYGVGQWEDKYIELLGEKAGREKFEADFAESMAATTGGATPTANMLMGYLGNHIKANNIKMPTEPQNFPHPAGGKYVTGNMGMYDKLITQGGGMAPKAQPKRYNFRSNFLGDTSKTTIDDQMSKGMFGLGAPVPGTYGLAELPVHAEAAKRGVDPIDMQAKAWSGFKGKPGKPMMVDINEAIARTSKITGQSQDEVVRNVIMNNAPLYGLGAGAVGAEALMGGEEQAPGGA